MEDLPDSTKFSPIEPVAKLSKDQSQMVKGLDKEAAAQWKTNDQFW